MKPEPIDPVLLEIFCRFCSENEAEAVTQEELDRLLDEGFTNVSHVTPMGAAYLVRALRLSELRCKWLEAEVRALADRGQSSGERDAAWEAYKKAGGVV